MMWCLSRLLPSRYDHIGLFARLRDHVPISDHLIHAGPLKSKDLRYEDVMVHAADPLRDPCVYS